MHERALKLGKLPVAKLFEKVVQLTTPFLEARLGTGIMRMIPGNSLPKPIAALTRGTLNALTQS